MNGSSEYFKRVFSFRWGVLFLSLAVLSSCKKNDGIGMAEEETLAANITDTLTVNTSTLLLDSLPSAGKGVLLTGRIADPELGVIGASSYFQISGSGLAASGLPADAKFDSVSLRLHYSGYYYGDTSQRQQLSVHRLSERLVLPKLSDYLSPDAQNVFSSSATFYNRTKFSYQPTPLASLSFFPKPASKDSLMIRLPDELGEEFFSLVKDESSLLSNTDLFLDYFNGLVLVPGENSGNAVVGFTDSLMVKVYYSYVDNIGLRKRQELSFSLYDNSYQFNHVEADRSGTGLKDLSLLQTEVASVVSSDKTYIQAMAGLVTRISVPYIRFLLNDHMVINKAELLIETPGAPYYLPFDRPSQLVLLVADQNNRPVQILSDANTGQSALYLKYGDYQESKASYSFPLTDYLTSYYTTYNNTSLLLSVPVADLQNTYNRLIVGSQANADVRIKLKVTYTKLNL